MKYAGRTRGLKCLKQRRYELRNSQTKAEELLWESLKKKKVDGRFRRQHGIGPYIVDFYHAESMTVIEIDGPLHENKENQENDKWREGFLIERGYKIIRFKNDEVISDIGSVLLRIKTCVSR